MSQIQVFTSLLEEVLKQATITAEKLKEEAVKSPSFNKEVWNNKMVPSFNYARLAVMAVYNSSRSFGDFTEEEVYKVIDTQPKWEKFVNFITQSSALVFPLK